MAYRLRYDLHTHTIYSHGKGSILDNAKVASEKGLSLLGIADHGFGHNFFGMKPEDVPAMRNDIEEAKKLFPELGIQLSVEANIINKSGNLDVSREEQKLFDYVIAGYHYGILGEDPLSAIGICLGGYVRLFSNRTLNTDIVVKALYENDIKLLSHPGDKIEVDIREIAKACEDTHTMMEINDHHKCLSVSGIRTAAEYDVDFVISSDAHIPQNVGNFERALKRAEAAALPLERIVNLWSS